MDSFFKNIPEQLIGPTSHLIDAFLEMAAKAGQERDEATALFKLLPFEIKAATAFLDNITKRWRYEFGEPLELPGSTQVLLGTHQLPEVEHLHLALQTMERTLPDTALIDYLNRLANKSKHQETLFEARPLFYLAEKMTAEYEVLGYGQGNRTIDWRFYTKDLVDILVEVKYRIGDVVRHFDPMAPDLNAGNDAIHAGPGKPEPLFLSTYEKFLTNNPSNRLQGAWIYTNIKVKFSELTAYFLSLPANQLHFAVLSNWNNTGLLLSREGVDRERIVRTFGLIESTDAVVDEN